MFLCCASLTGANCTTCCMGHNWPDTPIVRLAYEFSMSLYDGILNAIPEQRIQRTWFLRVLSSGIQCHAVHWKSTNVSEEHVASIFKIKEQAKQETSRSGQQAELVSCSSFSSTLKMEATCSFETSVDFQWTMHNHIPEGRTPHNCHCENLKSYMVLHSYL
jgi:hypothetical protein